MAEPSLPEIADLKNPDGLPKDVIEDLLKLHGGFLGDNPSQILIDAVRYLVEGGPADALLKLSGTDAAKELALHRADLGTHDGLRDRMRRVRRAIFSKLPYSAGTLSERLGDFFEASSQPTAVKFNRPAGWPRVLAAPRGARPGR